MSNRTGIDLSEHVLTIHKHESPRPNTRTNIIIYEFKKPNSYYQSVNFINTNGVLTITGDYGNWLFCREFHPSKGGVVSGHYWIEKLHISSSQVGQEFDSKATKKEIELGLKSQLEEYGYYGEDLETMKEYYNDLLEHVDYSEWEYTAFAYTNLPSCLDAESVPFIKDTKHWLKIIFDCFDEMCNRMEE